MNEQIERYLFNEMGDDERAQYEDKYFSDDALFYDVVERENDLVDRYTSGNLAGAELERFERSLPMMPGRRQKIANARVLSEYIAEERTEEKSITIAERTGLFAGLFRMPVFQFATVAAVLLLTVASIFLFVENRRLGSLESQLADARQRESELTAQIERGDSNAADLAVELARERERAGALETEISNLRKTPANQQPANDTGFKPAIATLLLGVSVRAPGMVPRLELARDVSRVSIVAIADEATPGDRVTVRLNGEVVASNLKVRTDKSVVIAVVANKLGDIRNTLTIFDSKGVQIAEYSFVVNRHK